MITYLIKRILIILPTLFILSILVFFLMDQVTSDIVQEELGVITWESNSIQQQGSFKQKESIIKKYHYDLRLFYFSIENYAIPDTLYRLFPLYKRKFIKEICIAFSDEKQIGGFITVLDSISTIHPLFQSIYLSTNEKDLISKLNEVQPEYPKISNFLKSRFSMLQESRGNFNRFIPKFKWNSKNCRYHHWLKGFLKFDFGRTLQGGLPINELVKPALWISTQIGGIAILLLFVISIPLGVYLSTSTRFYKNTILHFIYVVQAMPLFWIAEFFIVLFASKSLLYLFPSFGTGNETFELKNAVLPILSLVVSGLPIVTIQTKKAFDHYWNEPFVLTARSKGLFETTILFKHVLRNALTPLIMLFFSFLPSAISGVMIVEFVYSIPGAGRLLVDAVNSHDQFLILTLILIIGIIKTLSSLLADFGYLLTDPRVVLNE